MCVPLGDDICSWKDPRHRALGESGSAEGPGRSRMTRGERSLKRAGAAALAMAFVALMAFAQATEDLPEFRNSMDQTLAIRFSGISAEQEDAYLLRLGMTADMAIDMS